MMRSGPGRSTRAPSTLVRTAPVLSALVRTVPVRTSLMRTALVRTSLVQTALVLTAGLLIAAPVSAQAGAGCSLIPGVTADRCLSAFTAADQIRNALAVGHAQGAPLPGSVSTLGRRFGSTPRIGLSARVGVTRFDLTDADRWSSMDEDGVSAPVLSASVGVGILDGFSIAPTVGGVLALDVLADVSTVRLPSGNGFDGASTAFGYGVRVGLLRESFTLPGASVSLMRRTGASTTMTGSDGSLDTEVSTTSIRAVVGKEVLAFGVLGGVGWDRASADWVADLVVDDGPATIDRGESDDTETVTSVFLGITRTFLVAQLGLEAGWADGLFFGSFGARLTL